MRKRRGYSASWAVSLSCLLISLSAPFGWAHQGAPENGGPTDGGDLGGTKSQRGTISRRSAGGGGNRSGVAVTVGGARVPSLIALALPE